ncbi:M1-specific T cell receptor beta chain-like [Anabas testudineus]|uniref:M1-specific T cell receptor beta chain-like n=1 Tax=Anabas testudineus TaxID=64144 RepID=UPI000E459F3A|nr:M1-specific T cell receptor beta chain-like [Anabas testudineus]
MCPLFYTFGFLLLVLIRHVETVTFVQSSSQIVNEGTKELEIHCSHDGSTYTVMLWYQHKQSSRSVSLIGYTVLHSEPQNEDQFKQRFLLKRENMTQGSLIIHTVNASDSAVYYCAANFSFSVKIDQPPFVFSQKGESTVTLQCKQDDNTYYYMYWYKQTSSDKMQLVTYSINKNMSSIEAPFTSSKYFMSRPEVEQFYLQPCISVNNYDPAYFGKGTKLTVLEKDRKPTPPVVKVLPPSKDECRNQKDNEKKKTLVCVAKDFYPDHVSVSWKIENGDDNIGEATDTAALRTGDSYTITSRLRVSAKTWFIPTNVFTCNVTFFDGEKYSHYTNSINGEEAPDTNDMTREKFLKLSQNGKLSYGIFIAKGCVYGAFVAFLVWKLQGSTGK